MTYHLLKAVVNVPKQGVKHHEEMVSWCEIYVGRHNFQWFGYDIGANKTTLFHFYVEEAATAFVIRWGGNAQIKNAD